VIGLDESRERVRAACQQVNALKWKRDFPTFMPERHSTTGCRTVIEKTRL
jgi:hypothetical protein